MKRKITKQSLAELAKVMPTVPEWEMRFMVGGTGIVTQDGSGNIIIKEISGQLVYVKEDTGEIVGYLPELYVTAITGSNANGMLNYYLFLGYQYQGQDPTGNDPVWQGGATGGGSSSSSSSNISKAIDVTISSAGLAGIGEYNKRISIGNKTYWQGQNNKWYQSTWGGNQWTGARSLAYSTANMFKYAGRVTGIAGTIFNAYLISDSYQNGDTAGVIKNGLSAAVGIASTFGGPIGFLVGTAYFVLDNTGLIDKWINEAVD